MKTGPITIGTIITAPPYADFLEEAVSHPLVTGLRLNTVMPVRDGPAEAIERQAPRREMFVRAALD